MLPNAVLIRRICKPNRRISRTRKIHAGAGMIYGIGMDDNAFMMPSGFP
jgi:hypothetical protein